MKKLFLIFICGFSFLVIGMDAPQQISLLNDPESPAKDIRPKCFYPVLSIQDLGRLAQVNKQCLEEIGCVGLYKNTNFKGLQESVQSAWFCHHEVGCFPKMILSSLSIPCHKDVFPIRQDQLIKHWINKCLMVGIWSLDPQQRIVDKSQAGYSVNVSGDNYITLKSANSDSNMLCVDASYMVQAENPKSLNNIMTIYSIGNNVGSLNESELDAIINNDIEKPLIIAFENQLFDNAQVVDMLLKQLRKRAAEGNDKTSDCLQKFSLLSELYQLGKKVINEEKQKQKNELDDLKHQYAQLMADQPIRRETAYLSNPQNDLIHKLEDESQTVVQDNVPSPVRSRELPRGKNCLIQ